MKYNPCHNEIILCLLKILNIVDKGLTTSLIIKLKINISAYFPELIHSFPNIKLNKYSPKKCTINPNGIPIINNNIAEFKNTFFIY